MASNSFLCPYCSHYFALTNETLSSNAISFDFINKPILRYDNDGNEIIEEDLVHLNHYKCPHCFEISVEILGKGSLFKDKHLFFRPSSKAKVYPKYIPESVRQDYEEAYAILNLSPKASATLSRRCLQGMIRDFWDVKENSLYLEIKKIEDKVDPSVHTVLTSLRQLGNIGAHPEYDINLIVDIEPGEAEKLLLFIEFLIEAWYIKRQESEELFGDIKDINKNKQNQRRS